MVESSFVALKAPQAQGETIRRRSFARVITEVTQKPSDESLTTGSQEKGALCPRHCSGVPLSLTFIPAQQGDPP